MRHSYEFMVRGIPATQGSKRAYVTAKGKLAIVDTNQRLHSWRADVREAALQAIGDNPPLTGPVALTMFFYFPRPKRHYKKNGAILHSAPVYHVVKPDLSKLLRAAEDALKGIAWRDDSQVCRAQVAKHYGSPPGAYIQIIEEPILDLEPIRDLKK